MRRRLALVIVLVNVMALTPAPLFAQGVKLHWGTQIGVNLAQASYESEFFDHVDNKYSPGFIGGGTLVMSFPGQQMFSIESGLFFQMKGGKTEIKMLGTDTEGNLTGVFRDERRWKLNYLTVPLLVRASLYTGGLQPYVKAGPEFGILVSSKYERHSETPGQSPSPTTEIDMKDWSNSTDLALLFGAGLQFETGSAAFFAELSYSHSLTDVWETRNVSNETLKNRVVGLSAGVRF